MQSFHEYLNNKNDLLEENMLQKGALGVMAGLSAAGAANAEKFSLSGEADSFKPQINMQMPAGSIALKSFVKHGDYENGMKGNKAIKSITIDVMETKERHGDSFIVSIDAQIEAPDRATAKKILVSELMKVAAQKGIQKEMIGLLKSLQNQMNESTGTIFDLELEITSKGAKWV
jgi:hypothetical protein